MTTLSAERLARDGPVWRNTTIAREAWRKAQEQGDRVAIFLEHQPHATYAEFADEALRLIGALQELGLKAGDVVSFQLPNWREAVPLDIAAAALGLVVNPIVPIYRDAELRYILKDAKTRLFYIPESFRSIDYLGIELFSRPFQVVDHRYEVVDLISQHETQGDLRLDVRPGAA